MDRKLKTPYGELDLKIYTYPNKRIAILMYNSDGELFDDLTINLPNLSINGIDEGFISSNIDILTSDDFNLIDTLKKDGVIIINDCRIDPMTVVTGAKTYPENIIENLKNEHKIYAIDGLSVAKELGNSKVLNSVVLGFSAKHIGFTQTQWLDMVEKTVPQKTIEINKKAFLAGYNK